MTGRRRSVLLAACVVLGAGAVALAVWPDLLHRSPRTVTVYCAHDAVFAQSILDQFEQRTGIHVNVQYDSEATKSLGLVNKLKLEKEHPICDVFWNNQLLGTMDLASAGVLEPYEGSGYKRIPAKYRDDEGRWTGFAARMRVWIVNTAASKDLEVTQKAVRERFEKDPSRASIANPMFGTTLTHFSLLWRLWGPERLKSWRADLRRHGLIEFAGNAPAKDAVAEGRCDVGWTDTDDFFEALDDKKPVAMLPVLVEEIDSHDQGKIGPRTSYAIIIPNTVAIIRGTQRRKEAEELVDFLLSAETEMALANSKARQIPLGPVDGDKLSRDVQELSKHLGQGYDLKQLEGAQRDCLAWLKSESS